MSGITLYGLYHLAGQLVTVSIAGLDCGDTLVAANGSINIPFGADEEGLLTSAYLIMQNGSGDAPITLTVNSKSFLVTVAVQVGYSYLSEGQLLRPAREADIKSQMGQGLAKLRRVHQYGALFETTQGISFGTTFSNLVAIEFADTPQLTASFPYLNSQLFSGVWWGTLNDTESYDGELCWQISRPYMTKIVSLTSFMDTSER